MTINLTSVIVALIGLLGTIITAVVVPYFKSRTTQTQRENIYFWVKIAVEAAEKIYKESGQGAAKKEFVKQFLADHGIALDEDQIEVAIEAAVLQMQNELAA